MKNWSLIIIILIACIGLYRDFKPLNITKEIRSFGFEGKIEIYEGLVPCDDKRTLSDRFTGCYVYPSKFASDIIRIDGSRSKREVLKTIYHEIYHWKFQCRDEIKADEYAYELLK